MEFKPNFGLVELCLTYRCNVKCNNCSNLCTQAPSCGDLSPSDVEYFLNDISNASVGHITLHGGEPVLNPYIFDIIKLLVDFRKSFGTKLWLLSNSNGSLVQERISRISCDYDIPLGISKKNNESFIEYVPVNESPIDLNEPYTLGCFQTVNCGICYNYLGWFPCSPLAAAARVFDYKPTALSIKQLTIERCIEYFEMHCKHCGFAMPNRRRVKEQTSTQTWIDKLESYKRREQ